MGVLGQTTWVKNLIERQLTFHSFIHSLNKHLLYDDYVLATILDSWVVIIEQSRQ